MLLLDTHVVLWVLDDNPRLGERARTMISTLPAHISVASIWEMTVKAMLGKMRLPEDFEQRLDELGLAPLSIASSHAFGLRRFPEMVGHDPFDRLLMSQASVEGMQLLTADRVLLTGGYPFVTDARQ